MPAHLAGLHLPDRPLPSFVLAAVPLTLAAFALGGLLGAAGPVLPLSLCLAAACTSAAWAVSPRRGDAVACLLGIRRHQLRLAAEFALVATALQAGGAGFALAGDEAAADILSPPGMACLGLANLVLALCAIHRVAGTPRALSRALRPGGLAGSPGLRS